MTYDAMQERRRNGAAAIRTGGRVRAIRLTAAAAAAAITVACSSPEQRVEKYYDSGIEYLEKGDLAKANIQFRNVLKINEEHVPTLVAMSQIAEKRQDLKAMYGLLQNVVRLDPDNVDAHVQLGRLYLIGSDETAALEQAEKALAVDAGNLDAISLKAGVRLRLGDMAGAVELARRVVAVNPAHAEAVTVLATERAQAKDFEGSLAELDRALAVNPKIAILQLLRIRVLAMLERDDDVLDGYKRLADLFPEEPAYRRAYAGELVKQKNFAEAQRQIESVVQLDPSDLNAKLDVIRLIRAQQGAQAAEQKLRNYVRAEPKNSDIRFALVDFLVEQKSWETAIEAVRPLDSSNDGAVAAAAKNKLAAIYLLKGERDKAQTLVDEILVADNTNTDALIKRARLRIDDQQYDQALIDLRAALSNDPDAYEAMLLTASVFEKQSDLDVAGAELAKAFDTSGKKPRVASIFAKFLIRNNNLVRAEDILTQSLALFPRDLENLRLLASVRLSRQDWRGADEVAAIIESLDGADDEGLAQNIRTIALTGLEEYDKVIDLLTAQNEQTPLESRPLAMLTSAYVSAGRGDEARALLTDIIASDPENYDARILLARTLNAGGETKAAESALIDAVNANPERAGAYEFLYRYYIRGGEIEKAAALLERGLSITPDSVALRFFKADLLLTQGAREEALDLYADLIEKRPNDKIIANNFVSLSNELRQDEASAARALEVARVIENEDHPFYQDTVGWAYYRAGRFERALEYLSKAAAGADDNAEILYHLGAAQIAAGDPAAGRATLEKALASGGADFRYEAAVRDLLQQG